jgi:glycosyltransferase involved in cell wall biosynthesis
MTKGDGSTPSFTLIIPTLGRTDELERLFESLAAQDFQDFHCLVIDQNTNGLIDELLVQWQERLRIRRLRSDAGASRSRNLGLLHAKGDVVAFPDDDCWYPNGLLAAIAAWFEEHPGLSILSVGAKDEKGAVSGNRWFQRQCRIRPLNAFRTTFCSTLFVRRTVVCECVRFDEGLGPGANTGRDCGEETDFILALGRWGARGLFDRRWHVSHRRRDMLSGSVDAGRAASYGRGMGYVLNKQELRWLCVGFVLYDVLRAVLVGIKGNREAMALCLRHAAGIVAGWRSRSIEARVAA